MYALKKIVRAVTPRFVFSLYHLLLSFVGACLYGFPGRKLVVIGITGTKGKSSTSEYLAAILIADGKKIALSNGIRALIGEKNIRNTSRMSMPGRFALQKFLAQAVRERATHAIIEMTSEGAAQHRHRFLSMNGLIFTNLAPEHIESHGSLETYIDAKLSIGREMAHSKKRPRILVVNGRDEISKQFLALDVDVRKTFATPEKSQCTFSEHGSTFSYNGEIISLGQPGMFSIENAFAALTMAEELGVSLETIKKGLSSVSLIPGRAQLIDEGQGFSVVVDYAHNPSSLTALYDAYKQQRKICVLGATGGGRDTWKRPEMGSIADQYCSEVILTNEDPYDEEPEAIVKAIRTGMKREPMIILDRRAAIEKACALAQRSDVVLLTGKGTDPSIRGKNGISVPWSDAEVAREVLRAHKAR